MDAITFFAVGCGGALGAFCRALCTGIIERHLRHWLFKGAFFINMLACFAAGFLMCIALGNVLTLAVMVGFLGGFSTLSSVNLDAAGYWLKRQYGRCLAFLCTYYVTAFAVAIAGFAVAQWVI